MHVLPYEWMGIDNSCLKCRSPVRPHARRRRRLLINCLVSRANDVVHAVSILQQTASFVSALDALLILSRFWCIGLYSQSILGYTGCVLLFYSNVCSWRGRRQRWRKWWWFWSQTSETSGPWRSHTSDVNTRKYITFLVCDFSVIYA